MGDSIALPENFSDLAPMSAANKTSIKIISPKGSLLNYTKTQRKLNHSSRVQMSLSDFLQATTASERAALVSTLDNVICGYLKFQRPVLLENFGLLIMKNAERKKAYNSGRMSALRTEQVFSYDFEKCEHYETDYAARYPNLVKTTELTRCCRSQLKPDLKLLWSEKQLARLIRGLFKYIKQQLVQQGQFSEFKNLGHFVALHNRQGKTEADWYAGADIMLITTSQTTIATSDPVWFERPILEDAWELLKAAFDQPLNTFKIDLQKELSALGYNLSEKNNDTGNLTPFVEIAVFAKPTEQTSNQQQLLFCSKNLIDSLPLDSKPEVYTEFTWCVYTEQSIKELDWSTYQSFARRIFTLGWILLASAKHKQLPIGAGIASSISDCIKQVGSNKHCHLAAILTNSFKLYPGDALTNRGSFRYMNLLPITGSEYELAEIMSARYLIELLEKRGLDQVTKLYRKPINIHLASIDAQE